MRPQVQRQVGKGQYDGDRDLLRDRRDTGIRFYGCIVRRAGDPDGKDEVKSSRLRK